MKNKAFLFFLTLGLASCSLPRATSSLTNSSEEPHSSDPESLVEESSSIEQSSDLVSSSLELASEESKESLPSSSFSSEEPISSEESLEESSIEEQSSETPISSLEPTSSDEAVLSSEEPVSSLEELVSSEAPFSSEEPMSSEEPISSEEPLSSEEPFSSEEPVASSEESISSEELISSEEPLSSEESSELVSSKIESSSVSSSDPSSYPSDFLSLFDAKSRVSISIKASDDVLSTISDLQGTRNSRYADLYFPVDVTFSHNGTLTEMKEVGMRMKGNTSRSCFFDGSRFTNLVHFKLSFKATFDDELYDIAGLSQYKHDWSEDSAGRKARKKRTYCGLEKLDLKYVPRNYGMVAEEIYAYDRFREAGIPTPYANLAEFELASSSDSYRYLYEIVEPIDKEFLKKRYGKDGAQGDLYKCTYKSMGAADLTRENAIYKSGELLGQRVPQGKIGVSSDWDNYYPSYDLKTNDDLGEESDFSTMADYIKTIHGLRYGNLPESELHRVLDVDEFIRFSALSYLFGNPDDQRYNANNYYLYFKDDGKAVYIPYDWDWCLGITYYNDVTNFRPFDEVSLSGSLPNVYYDTFIGDDSLAYDRTGYKNDYIALVRSYAETALDPSRYSALLDELGLDQSYLDNVSNYMSAKKGVID